jgi:hypothetical protein
MFKPAFDNFRATFRDHASDFGNLMRFESTVESYGEIIQPDFTFAPALKTCTCIRSAKS